LGKRKGNLKISFQLEDGRGEWGRMDHPSSQLPDKYQNSIKGVQHYHANIYILPSHSHIGPKLKEFIKRVSQNKFQPKDKGPFSVFIESFKGKIVKIHPMTFGKWIFTENLQIASRY
jgi:hypothetical protein